MHVEMPRAENGVHNTQRYFCLAIWCSSVGLLIAPQDLSPGLLEWDLKGRSVQFVATSYGYSRSVCFQSL